MAFGIKSSQRTNVDSYNVDYTVEVAEMKDNDGTIVNMHTHGGKKEVSEDFFLGADESTITNEAVNGQSGTSDIVTKHSLVEKGNEYQKVTITKVSALPKGS